MFPQILNSQYLDADQQVAASAALVDLGAGQFAFSFVLPAGKRCIVDADLPFTVGATGGFKFQLTSSQALVDYMASWTAIDGVTAAPGSVVNSTITAQAAFANAWAVAGNHQCNLHAGLKGHATLNSTISIQFACNSAANAISILKGASMAVRFI